MLQSPLTLAQVANHNKAGSDQNDQIFVGSRACAANHYVIAGKCPHGIYLCMSTSSTDCRLSEQVSITRSLYLSGNVVKHTELLKKNISCLQGTSICIYDDLETF